MVKKVLILIVLVIHPLLNASAQMKRERVQTDEPVTETFWAPNLVGMGTVETVAAQNLNVTIMHNFGLINDEPFHNFLGLDFGATVRLGLDYGLSDRWSVGIGRTSRLRAYDIRTKYTFLTQNDRENTPVSLAVKGNLGIDTNKNGYTFDERLNYFSSLMIARKFTDQISLQVTPMYTHFNRVFGNDINDHFAVGLGGEYQLSDRWAIIAEYFPVIGDRSPGTVNAFALGLNIETGGHVFQLFLKSSNWHTEQYIITENTDDFWAGDIRFGFNVNRIFWTGKKRK